MVVRLKRWLRELLAAGRSPLSPVIDHVVTDPLRRGVILFAGDALRGLAPAQLSLHFRADEFDGFDRVLNLGR